jgi:hypothetical protein
MSIGLIEEKKLIFRNIFDDILYTLDTNYIFQFSRECSTKLKIMNKELINDNNI